MINILIIDDDIGDIKLIQKTLRRDDGEFNFFSANSLEEGIQTISDMKDLNLVLLDLSLPESHGLDTVDKFINRVTQALPFIVLTGLDSEEIGVQAIQKGAQDYLVKEQYNRANLIRSIRYAIGRYHIILEQKRLDQLKNQFISTAAHELRTPMAIIQASLGSLMDQMLGGLNERQAPVAEVAKRNAMRLNKIITNLLDISRLESGQIQPKFIMASLKALIRDTLDGLEKLTEENNLKLLTNIASNLPPQICLDEELIIQVINNITSNALRYAKREILISVKAQSDGVLFSIGNDGPSLSPEDQAKLFNKFCQINRPQGGAGYKGTGLGLAICKEIVRQHSGRIWVESAENQLTSFNFIIPTGRVGI